jgi:PKD repeat protein
MMDVYFYGRKAVESDFTLINKFSNVISGNIVSCNLNLPFDTVFAWYVKVNNSKLENQSNIWFFTTRARPAQNEPPVADPGKSHDVKLGQIVVFDASGSYDPDGKIEFYRWNFGDGTSEILDVYPSHLYSNLGTYLVNLTVIDDDGTSAMATVKVTINSSENRRPTAKISGSKTGKMGESIIFIGSASSDPDEEDEIVSYIWNFGDGTTEAATSPTHAYSKSGNYTVTLTVTDREGLNNTASTYIDINIQSSNKKSPGYELALAIVAVLLVLVWRRRI